MSPALCPKCGHSMDYGKAQRCRTCVLEARRASYRQGRERSRIHPARTLLAAAKKGDLSVVSQWLCGHSTPADGRKALIVAAKYGQCAVVELLLPTHGDPDVIAAALNAAVFYYHSIRKTAGHRAAVDREAVTRCGSSCLR